MSYSLILNSTNVIGINNNMFRYNFVNGFEIKEGTTMAVSQITMPYSFGNVSAFLGNNTFQYTMPTTGSTSVTRTITLSDGFYDINALNQALWADMKSQLYYFYNPQSTLISTTTSTSYPNILFPISFASVYSSYTNSITLQYIPTTSGNVTTQYGTGWLWALGTFPTTATLPSVTITGLVTASTTNFGNILGFTQGQYPTSLITYAGTPTIATSQPYVILGNTLKASPPFPPLATIVNSVVVHCDLVLNQVTMPNDVLDNFPITSTYGSNINYFPIADNAVKVKAGKYQTMTITLTDQNFNPIICLDPNVLIAILIHENSL